MRKRLIITTIILAPILLIAIAWISILTPKLDTSVKACAFCNSNIIANQVYYEGQHVRVLLNYMPILEGHSLVIPKRHVERFEDLSVEELTEMHAVIQKVGRAFQKVYDTSDYLISCQNGERAGQTVGHVHFHVIPRVEKNVITKLQLWYAMLVRPLTLSNPLSSDQIKAISAPLAAAMD